MRFVDFVFSPQASIAVVMRKPAGVVGTLFSFDTASAFNAELALSFEGPGTELRAYFAGEDKMFDLSFNNDAWIVLGFSWSWSLGDMDLTVSIDDLSATISILDVPDYRDTPFSTHFWGNSRLTQFGITRLFDTFLEVYIHSIHIRNTSGLFSALDEHKDKIS